MNTNPKEQEMELKKRVKERYNNLKEDNYKTEDFLYELSKEVTRIVLNSNIRATSKSVLKVIKICKRVDFEGIYYYSEDIVKNRVKYGKKLERIISRW